jgi:predicted nucleotidyltransferase
MLNFKKNQLDVLRLLVSQPDRSFFFSEIGEAIGKHPGVFQRGINALERDGFVISFKRGNQRVFQINVNNPIFTDLKSIIEKTVGAEKLLRDVCNNHPGIITALIYGSYARDVMRPDSDIDLLVVVADNEVENVLIKELAAIEKKIRRPINYKAYSKPDFQAKKRKADPFLSEVLKQKFILLKGTV